MKWKTAVGFALALAGWSRFSEDLPKSNGLIGPPEPPPKRPPKEYPYACPYPYTNLTFLQLQNKLVSLEMDFKQGRISQDQYDSHFGVIQTCKGLL